MRGSTRAAVALGVGYVLGRRHKLRTATVMAVATAAGGTTIGGMALRRGTKLLGSTDVLGKVTPQLGEIAEVVRGDLVGAGKAAATAAVSSRVDALTDSLHERAERLRSPGAAAEDDEPDDEADDQADDQADEAPARSGGRGRSPVTRASSSTRDRG